jgi:hypothetical protein
MNLAIFAGIRSTANQTLTVYKGYLKEFENQFEAV